MVVQVAPQAQPAADAGQSLTDRMADAARDAVLARRSAIENGGARNLSSITVEIQPSNGCAIVDVTSYLSWRDVIREARRGG